MEFTAAEDQCRERVVGLILTATTLDGIAEARAALQEWVTKHPHDLGITDGFDHLATSRSLAEVREFVQAQHAWWLIMKKQWKWALGIAAFCILAPIAETALVLETRFHARDEGAAAASGFLAALGTHSYKKAHAMLTVSQQQAFSVSALQRAEDEAEKKYGKPTHEAMVDEYYVNGNFRQARLLYDNAYSNQRDLVLVTVVRTDSGWQVQEYQYDYNTA